MFKTIKSKILLITFIMLAVLMSAFGCHTIISRMKTKQLMVQNYKFSISSFVEDIDDSILQIENNLKSLSLIGSLYYKTDRSSDLTNKAIERIFENYPNSLGGGIWFKPYIVDKSKKYMCFYAYRNKDNKIIVDKNFASEEYDYPNQGWYKQIIPLVTPKRNIVWTKPYYENLGSYTKMVTAGTGIYVDGKLVGVATVDWEVSSVFEEISKMKPYEKTLSMYRQGNQIKNSFALFGNADQDYIIATSDPYLDNDNLIGHSLKEIPWYADNLYAITYITYHGKKYVPFVNKLRNGMVLIISVPKSEMFKDINRFYFYIVLITLLIGIFIPSILYYGMNRYIINPIGQLTDIAHKIGKGEDVKIKIEKPEEFAQLASTFDKMTRDIKTVTKEREKINSELNVAKAIQASSLPNVFPPFPERSEFDVYASMEPAKEVGGDFYDFYFIDEDNFMFLIADVSGKGVPAALFMMTVKTLINNISLIGYPPEKLIETVNKKITETNKHGFFVTMLAGIMNTKTGALSLINCGHNPPLIKRADSSYEYLKLNSNIALGVIDDAEWGIYETQLNKGDIMFTYTDGITEATNNNEEMYGEQKLSDYLNEIKDKTDITEIVKSVKNNIKEFTDSAPQSDDITMLAIKYNGPDDEKIFKNKAVMENYKPFYTWLHNKCDKWQISDELANKIDMCAEEIYANITFYAYPEAEGTIEVFADKTDDEITLKFTDEGIPYNPLEKPDPDITLPPEERPSGGLGIFMVKNMAKDVTYERHGNKNILTLKF